MNRLLSTLALCLLAATASANTTGSLVVLKSPESDQQLWYDTNIVVDMTSNTIKICGVTIGGGSSGGSTPFVSPLTTKGDLYTYGTADTRFPIGTMGQALTPNDNATQGLEWTTVYPGMTKHYVEACVRGNSTTIDSTGNVGGTITATTTVNGDNVPGRAWIRFDTAATTSSVASLAGNAQFQANWDPDFTFVVRTDSVTIANSREYVGLGETGDPTTSDVTTTKFLGFRYSTTAAAAHWYGYISNGSTATTVDTGVTVSAATTYVLRCTYDSTGNVAKFYINGSYKAQIASATGTPGTTYLAMRQAGRTLDGTIKQRRFGRFSMVLN